MTSKTAESLNLAERISARLDELSLLGADRVLDDARRLMHLKAFSGWPDEMVTDQVEPDAIAVEIAGSLNGLTLHGATVVLELARQATWGARFIQDGNSHFARAFVAAAPAGSESKQ